MPPLMLLAALACPAIPTARGQGGLLVMVAPAPHEELRNAQHAPLPGAPTQIRLFAAGGHLETDEYSVIATREPHGTWRLDARGRFQSWADTSRWTAKEPVTRELSYDEGRRLDAILADPCFYAEPATMDGLSGNGPPLLGALVVTLETASPGHHRSASLIGPVGGLTGEVERLLQP